MRRIQNFVLGYEHAATAFARIIVHLGHGVGGVAIHHTINGAAKAGEVAPRSANGGQVGESVRQFAFHLHICHQIEQIVACIEGKIRSERSRFACCGNIFCGTQKYGAEVVDGVAVVIHVGKSIFVGGIRAVGGVVLAFVALASIHFDALDELRRGAEIIVGVEFVDELRCRAGGEAHGGSGEQFVGIAQTGIFGVLFHLVHSPRGELPVFGALAAIIVRINGFRKNRIHFRCTERCVPNTHTAYAAIEAIGTFGIGEICFGGLCHTGFIGAGGLCAVHIHNCLTCVINHHHNVVDSGCSG